MVLLVPLLVSAVAAPVLVSVLFVVFFFVNPAACIVVFGLYWVYQQWLYHYKVLARNCCIACSHSSLRAPKVTASLLVGLYRILFIVCEQATPL